jgi:uncharacterized membrane protein
MVIFHSVWDLSIFNVIPESVPHEPGWRWFARLIAASFLALVGVSLVLGHGSGLRPAPFLRRLALVAGAALLVTVGTWYLFAEAYVVFGILHHIAVASVLALPFLRLPAAVVALSAAIVLALPHVFVSSAFESPWLIWLGLGRFGPGSVDFVPIFPWFGCVLAGVALGRIGEGWLRSLDWRAAGRATGALALAGRNSLLVYVVHQPVLFAIIWLIAKFAVSPHAALLDQFEADCRAACKGPAATAEYCAASCACTRAQIAGDSGILAALRSGNFKPAEEKRLSEAAGACAREGQLR